MLRRTAEAIGEPVEGVANKERDAWMTAKNGGRIEELDCQALVVWIGGISFVHVT